MALIAVIWEWNRIYHLAEVKHAELTKHLLNAVVDIAICCIICTVLISILQENILNLSLEMKVVSSAF